MFADERWVGAKALLERVRSLPSTLAPAELHIYDFDGTVFQTLGPREVPERYRELTGRPWPHRGWPLSHAASLQPPLPVLRGFSKLRSVAWRSSIWSG